MSLEQSIADLVKIGTANLALPQTIANLAATLVTNIGVEYQNRVSGLKTEFYVSAVGDNDATGTILAPLFSITEALRRTPLGGVCTVYLMTNYGLTVDTEVDGRHLIITSPNATRFALSFDRTQETIANVSVRKLRSFKLRNGGSIRFVNVGLLMPVGDGTFLTLPQDTRSAVVQVDNVSATNTHFVGFYYCDIGFPDQNFGPMVGSYGLPTILTVNNCVISLPMAGKWLYSVTNTSGTDSKSLPWLVTNLDLV